MTIQVKLQSDDSSVSGHFAVLNKSIDSGKDIFIKQNARGRLLICSKVLRL